MKIKNKLFVCLTFTISYFLSTYNSPYSHPKSIHFYSLVHIILYIIYAHILLFNHIHYIWCICIYSHTSIPYRDKVFRSLLYKRELTVCFSASCFSPSTSHGNPPNFTGIALIHCPLSTTWYSMVCICCVIYSVLLL